MSEITQDLSSSIHVANGKILFFFSISGCVRVSHLLYPSLDTWVTSLIWLLQIMLQKIGVHVSLWTSVLAFWGKYQIGAL